MYKQWMVLLWATFFTPYIMAQQNNYTADWKKIAALEKKGLTKDARQLANTIYKKAFANKNEPQQVKSCMYLLKYRGAVEEKATEKNIVWLDSQIKKTTVPVRNLLQSIQAEMYWKYLQDNRWKFYDRTTLANDEDDLELADLGTWTLNKLLSATINAYQASLSNKDQELLKRTPIDRFDDILIKGENTRQLRPTLYDFLAFRALDFYQTDEAEITRPADAFTINDPAAFLPATEFIKHRFATTDTLSLQWQALQLLQQVMRFHIADADGAALLDANLIRLKFVYENCEAPQKEIWYEQALQQLETNHSKTIGKDEAIYRRAVLYHERGQEYQPLTHTKHQYEIKRAKELCDTIVKQHPKTEGGFHATQLLNSILQPLVELETETVNLPQQPFRALVTYRNTAQLYCRIVKTTKKQLQELEKEDNEKSWQKIAALKPMREWMVPLPDLKDYQTHRTEIKIDAIDHGLYLMLVSTQPDFATTKNIGLLQSLYISHISYIHHQDEYYLLHRNSGAPLAGAKVQVWEHYYDYKNNQYQDKKAELLTADATGKIVFTKSQEQNNIKLQVFYQDEELYLDESQYRRSFYNEQPTKNIPRTFLFTDRAIYRPGQLLYFKGILVNKAPDASATQVSPNVKTNLQLLDANGQKINELVLTTNQYGSFHGSFKLPEGGLNGQFQLWDSATDSRHYFNVEEYKRPKFLVEINAPKGSYKVNDSITVTGTAKGYAGNSIDGALVKYKVTRRSEMPFWKMRGFWPGRDRDEMSIAHGQVTTNSKGEFDIKFTALPDESVSKEDQPIFRYEVEADVTDANGETRSGNTTVNVAYQAIQLNIDLPEEMNADSLKEITVTSKNINDISEKTSVTVSIQQLQAPAVLYRVRYWEQPDLHTLSQEEYRKLFPYDVYSNENEVSQYPVQEKLLEQTDTSNKAIKLPTVLKKWPAGWYKIVATAKDKYGEKVVAEKYVMLTRDNEQHEPISFTTASKLAEPGEQISYQISTAFDKIWLLQKHYRQGKPEATTIDKLTQPQPVLATQLPVYETDRGGVSITYAFVKNNRVYSGSQRFDVPWSNKELQVNILSFRDKLEPGAREKWTVKIAGHKGEKLAAELLTAMYDASLDAFKPHRWGGLDLWPGYNQGSWQQIGFGTNDAENWWEPETNITEERFLKFYDYLGIASKGLRYIGENHTKNNALWWLNPLDYAYDKYYERAKLSMSAPPPEINQVKFTSPKVLYDSLVLTTGDARLEEIKEDQLLSFGKRKIPKPVFDDADGDGKVDQFDKNNNEVTIRKNLSETAFFFPDLTTDSEGNTQFSFTMPEALTQWKLMALAHTPNAASGYTEKTLITQKPLMIQPNAPRFLREGDQMEWSAKIINLSDSELTGTTTLELLDAATGKPVDGWFNNVFPNQYFTVAAGQSAVVKFPITVPFNFSTALQYRMVAKSTGSQHFSDGETAALPVLTNRTLVTESLPININAGETEKAFSFDRLKNSASSSTLQHQMVTVEFTANPVWNVVKALPYLMEYPYECAEQNFNRLYANTLAAAIANQHPKIKAVFEQWKQADTTALISKLQQNQELKSALLAETPWVLDAADDASQRKNIALLFDLVKLAEQRQRNLQQLKNLQSSNGGFVWFPGGPDDVYITQYIMCGIGHLQQLNALPKQDDINDIVKKALPYLDKKIADAYQQLIKSKAKMAANQLNQFAIQYLYMRSFFSQPLPAASQKAYQYYLGQSNKYWLSQSKYLQAMIALALHRSGNSSTAKQIMNSLAQNAIVHPELGMYWKEWTSGGYYWYQAPIESHALLMEAFATVAPDVVRQQQLSAWLLKQKQTQSWKTTRATAEACYALLHQWNRSNTNLLSETPDVTITLGSQQYSSAKSNAEAGTGYFKQQITAPQVNAGLSDIQVKLNAPTKAGAFGAVYWQYFEDLDKITAASTPLQLSKQLYKEVNTQKGAELEAIVYGATLKTGDKIKVRLVLTADRAMEYLHLKDLRAAGLEPVNVLSEYRYQGGLGYYESTKDASSNFFIAHLAPGTYVFEYPLFVTHTGTFSNGIASIQCMYAPEFISHSNGLIIKVE